MATELVTKLLFADLAFLIPLIPAIAFPIILFFGNKIREHGAPVAIGAVGLSWILSVIVAGEVFLNLLSGEEHVVHENTFNWISIGAFKVQMGILVDPLAALMLLVVSSIALLVIIYSVGYMHGESGLARYYGEMCLFSAAMLGLSISPSFIVFFLFWEGVGVCSYLLIGFYYDKEPKSQPSSPPSSYPPMSLPQPSSASKKAFLMTKIGDVMLMVGFILLFLELGTFNFLEAETALKTTSLDQELLIGVLIFGGAIGKSAQFPLHTWLPDAMAGPTTVSALIHSATMVKAGVFLVARTYWVYGSDALLVIAVIGGFTAIMSALIALITTDIKGILAYSTISQLGYIIMAMGVEGMGVGMFHLLNHAAFKALLFLSAGSVIHATHTQDIRQMGGLQRDMKTTAFVMFIASLALAGIFPLNGFFSKDAIILDSYLQWIHTENFLFLLVWISGVVTAFLTAFYIFRMWFIVFRGNYRGEGHPHESPRVMTVPLMILAGAAIGLGLIAIPGLISTSLSLEHFLVEILQHHVVEIEETFLLLPAQYGMAIFSLIVAILGIALAFLVYYPRGEASLSFTDISFQWDSPKIPDGITGLQGGFRSFFGAIKASSVGVFLQHTLEGNNPLHLDYYYYGFANIFDTVISEGVSLFDKLVVDGLVNLIGIWSVIVCGWSDWIDRNIIDGVVNGIGFLNLWTARLLRRIQTGVVENYSSFTALGIIMIIIVFLAFSGFGI